jgi:hemoglobin
MTARRLMPVCLLLAVAGCVEGQKPTPGKRSGVSDRQAPDVKTKVGAKDSLYQRLGGEKGITRIVDDFVANVVADPLIREAHKRHFRDGDVEGLKRKLIDQFGQATGGPQKYAGKNMRDAHKGLGITDADFDALLADLRRALEANGVGPADRDEILGMLEKMRPEVVERP